jgi:KEOPS complex subunit Pcc1
MLNEAHFEVELSNAEFVYKALLPEMEKTRRAEVSIKKSGKKILLSIKAEDKIMLRAAINTWLRNLKIAQEMVEIARERRKQKQD